MNQTCQFISYETTTSNDNGLSSVTRGSSLIFSIYRQFYVYFVLAFGPINIIANLLSMFILTRKELRGSYSYLFFFMTFDHTIVVFFLVLTVIRSTFTSTCDPNNNTLILAIFSIVSQNAMDILRAHASWLAVVIASLRFFAIRRRGFLEPSFLKICLWCSLSLAVLLAASTPVFMSTSIHWLPMSKVCRWRNFTDDVIVATVREAPWVYYDDCLVLRITYFIQGTLHNGIPCVLLFFLSVLLLRQLRVIRKEFMSSSKIGNDNSSSDDRVTKMMTIILITTIVSEMPQSVLNILVAFLPNGFRANIVDRLGNILMTIMLITSACNLFVYLSMSRKFKEVAKRYFLRAIPFARQGKFSISARSSFRSYCQAQSSLIFNSILLFLISTKSPEAMHPFTIFLANNAVVDIISSVSGALSHLRKPKNAPLAILNGPAQVFGKEFAYASVSIQSLALVYGMHCFPMSFRYRYNLITKGDNASSKRIFIQLLIAFLVACFQMASMNSFVWINDLAFGEIIISQGLYGSQVLIIEHNANLTQIIVLSSPAFTVLVYATSLCYAVLIAKSLREQAGMIPTESTSHQLHRQLLITLLIQLALPIIFIMIPSIIAMLVHYGVSKSNIAEFLIFPLAYSTFTINPLITMSVVSAYRQALIDMGRRVKRRVLALLHFPGQV